MRCDEWAEASVPAGLPSAPSSASPDASVSSYCPLDAPSLPLSLSAIIIIDAWREQASRRASSLRFDAKPASTALTQSRWVQRWLLRQAP